uniref:Armadillo repeat-containing domain-containing protein n=1 Tax=Aegilops tauschii subsp. strangulata TaxID=200361 RepID=A0A453M9J8_AEGTS
SPLHYHTMQPPPESTGDALAECFRLLDELPAAAALSPAFRRHWPSISASLSSLSASLSHPTFPPSAPLLEPLASALSALMSVCSGPPLGHLHTVSLLSSSAASLSQLAADARLLVSPAEGNGSESDGLLSRLRLGSFVSRAAALDSLAESVRSSQPGSCSAAAVSAVAAMLDSGDLLPASRDKAVSVLAASQAAAAGVLRNIAAFPDLLPAFSEEGAIPLLVQLVSLGTPRAQEHALGCLRNVTASDGGEGQSLKVEAFQAGALACVKDFLNSCRGDEPGLAPAFGLLRNMASFRLIAEIAVSATFLSHVVAALGSDEANTRTEAAMALAELCHISSGKARGEVGDAMPRLVWMLEAKAVAERDAAARALATLVAASSSYRALFRKEEMGIVNVVRLLDPAVRGGDKRFSVSVLLGVSQSRRCRKQMVAAGACGFVQALLAAEVDGAKKLSECLGRGKMLGVFPRT